MNKPFFVRFEVFTAMTRKKAIFLDVVPVDIVLTNVSEERIASIFRVEEKKKIRERGTSVSRC
jgi:hypothetical protein